MKNVFGYTGKILRVDLTNGLISTESLEEAVLRQFLGGTGLGAKILYEEVPPGIAWNAPGNRLIMASGPLGGTRVGGSGTFSVVTKGALTQGATSTQANGFFGAFLRLSGFDAVVVLGASPQWVYLYIHDESAELRDANSLVGLDTWRTEEAIKAQLGISEHQVSVFGIGPAGENGVRFAAIVGDKGHVAAHNGPGAVMGSKRLKAVAVARGQYRIPLKDRDRVSAIAKKMLDQVKTKVGPLDVYNWGTLQAFVNGEKNGTLPIKNYTTNIFPGDEETLGRFSAQYIRSHFRCKPNPCWACQMHHCHLMTIPEGPYAGQVIEEPEYESWAACGPLIGNVDVFATAALASEVDRLGLDVNESGWVVAFAMECFEKGILNAKDFHVLDLRWGNVESARALLHQIAQRRGLGNILAEGVMRAAQQLGPGAMEIAIYTGQGNTPRGHDHRASWLEFFDTCVSSSGTIETKAGVYRDHVSVPTKGDAFSPEHVATLVALTKGFMQFEDSLGVCSFNVRADLPLLVEAVNAACGWDITLTEAQNAGRRIVNLLRAFNIRRGITGNDEIPSRRYGSTPMDGPAKGKSIVPAWQQMLSRYRQLMGWDQDTGKPLPETLKSLGLERVTYDIWGE